MAKTLPAPTIEDAWGPDWAQAKNDVTPDGWFNTGSLTKRPVFTVEVVEAFPYFRPVTITDKRGGGIEIVLPEKETVKEAAKKII